MENPAYSPSPEEINDALRLIRRLPRRNPVRRIAEAYLADPTVPPAVLQPMTQSLFEPRGWRTSERELAAWLLSRPPLRTDQRQPAISALLHTLHRRPQALVNWSCLLFLCFPVWWVWGVIALIIHGGNRRLNRVRCASALGLGRMHAGEALTTLAHIAVSDDQPATLRRYAKAAVVPLVADITAYSQYGTVPRETLESLCLLLWKADEPLALTILGALEQVGTGATLETVQTCARRGRSKRVRQEAERIIPTLVARRDREMAPHLLLRPAGDPNADLLLRPATAGAESDPALLLRPLDGTP